MENRQYISPAVRLVDVSYDHSFCISGNHEGITEENWDEP